MLKFSQLSIAKDLSEVEAALKAIVTYLWECVGKLNAPTQRKLFACDANPRQVTPRFVNVGHSVTSLAELVSRGLTFSTVFADPPWAYVNEASRAAAVNHYPTMSVEEICQEPVIELVAKHAHLHLWTTNGSGVMLSRLSNARQVEHLRPSPNCGVRR